MTRPLLLTADETLRDEMLRLSAAAGAAPEVARDPAAVLRSWSAAPVVLVGADLAERAAACAPPRRREVHVVGWDAVDPGVLRAALDLGAEGVCELPHGEGWLVERLTDLADARESRHVLAPALGVVGGRGGAGATTLACALAQVAAERGPCLVLDADPLGPGADRVLGLEDVAGVRWDALAHAGGRLGATSLREAVPARAGLGVLSWPAESVTLAPTAAAEALSAARRGHDLVVVDLPRRGPGADDLAARCDRVLVVTTSSVPALASTVRTCEQLGDGTGLVVRGRGPDHREIERVTGVVVLGSLPEQRGLAEAVDLGLGPVRSRRSPLARAARRLLDACLADLVVGRAA
ncbi:septum site determining protein [Nocardioides lentus]|uniref:Septum site determining protein n=1 Tax=Nocardioides lentus TaxID=338077 RepID=A0ABP5AH73_9ACTN